MSVVLILLVSLPFLAVLLTRPVERRLALRYPRRRPTEALLVVLGSLLGTAIVTGSLIEGDTIDRSIRASAYEQLGPIDEVVAVSGITDGEAVAQRFEGFASPEVDGTLRLLGGAAAVTGRSAQPTAQVLEVDAAAAHDFGGDPAATGISGPTPAAGHAVITRDVASRAQVGAGDRIAAYVFGQRIDLLVDRVVERKGVAGFWTLDRRQQSYNVFVAPGTMSSLYGEALRSGGATVQPPTSYLAFSNSGGVEGGAARTSQASAAISGQLTGIAGAVQPVKHDLLEAADRMATSLTQMYFTLGMFAVSAGVLLLVNIFVMLTDERRSALGMLRALGLRRLPLVRAFATEGWLYALVAAGLGALAGIGIGWLIAWRAGKLLGRGTETTQLHLSFAFHWSTVLQGLAAGLVIALLTIIAASVRVSRMNIIAAIREQPAAGFRSRGRRVPTGLVLTVLGALVTAASIGRHAAFGVILGPIAVMLGLGLLAAGRAPARRVVVVVGLGVLAWGATFLVVLSRLGIDVTIPMFLAQGLAMAGAAVAVATACQERVAGAVARLTGRSMPVRIGVLYPVARRFRSAMTLGMFAIVILTLVYLSTISFMFHNEADTMTAQTAGGFDVVVNSNPTNPLTAAALRGTPGVNAVAPLAYANAQFVHGDNPPTAWPLTGFGAELAADPPAMQDLGPFPSAASAWSAVLADPNLVIVDPNFLASGGGPPAGTPRVGDTVRIIEPVTGVQRDVTVAALTKGDVTASGAWYGISGFREVFGDRTAISRFFAGGSGDPSALAERISSAYVANGADAQAVRDLVASMLSQSTGFFTLMEQFVGAGLIVGIAGIGVLLVRAVRERRRDIGVLRSLGFPARKVAGAFLVEAAFLAVEGVAIGVAVALIGCYGLVHSGVSFAEDFKWAVPWPSVLTISGIAILTSVLVALWPARRASRIQPAVALRIAD